MLVLFQLLAPDRHILFEGRQLCGLFLRLVLALHIKRGEAGEIHNISRRLEGVAPCFNIRLGGFLDAVSHLRRGEAAPNQLIKLILVGGKAALDAVGRERRHGGTNRLVTVLSVLSGFKVSGLRGEILRAVCLIDIPGYLLYRDVGDTERVGSHVGDQTCRAHSLDFNTLVQLLRDLHGAAGLKAQLPGRLLLEC